jgi:protein TonB
MSTETTTTTNAYIAEQREGTKESGDSSSVGLGYNYGGPGGPGGPDDPDPDDDRQLKIGVIALTASGVVFLLALLFSAILQGGGLAYLLHFVPPPARTDDSAQLAQRFVRFQQMEEVEPEPEQPEPEDKIEEEEEAPPEPPPEPEEEEEVIQEEPEEIEEPPPEPQQEQPQETGFAVETYGGEGSSGPSIRTGGAMPGEEIADEPTTRRERRQERQAEREAEERRGPVRMEDTSTPPQPVQTGGLGYPQRFKDAGIEGRVIVQCIITEQGRPVACRHRSGPEELGQYVISVVRNWRFTPGKDHNQQPVPVVYTFQIPFRLRAD